MQVGDWVILIGRNFFPSLMYCDQRCMIAISWQPAKTSISPRSSPLGTFRTKERLKLSGRNSILMTQINVYIINPVVMGFQIQICPILRVFWFILVKCCVHLPTSSSKTQRRVYSTNIDCFARDSSRLHLTFMAFCLSFVNNS